MDLFPLVSTEGTLCQKYFFLCRTNRFFLKIIMIRDMASDGDLQKEVRDRSFIVEGIDPKYLMCADLALDVQTSSLLLE